MSEEEKAQRRLVIANNWDWDSAAGDDPDGEGILSGPGSRSSRRRRLRHRLA